MDSTDDQPEDDWSLNPHNKNLAARESGLEDRASYPDGWESLDLQNGMRAAFAATSEHETIERVPTARSLTQIKQMPTTIAGYRMIRRLGSGGMGVVYEAEQDSPRRRVALKVVRNDLNSTRTERFVYESQILARLSHESIAEIYESGNCARSEVGAVAYFAMALVENARSITDYAMTSSLDTRRRIELFLQVLDGIEHGHDRGIVHRDIKPSNLLVDTNGSIKIIDFGLARATLEIDDLQSMHTQSGEMLGTPHYMSPEQWREPKAADARSDVYSLGIVLFQLLSGRLPFDLAGKTMFEIAEVVQIERASTLDLAGLGPRNDISIITQKAMEQDLDRRYATVASLSADLRRYLADQPITARRPSAIYQVQKFARRNRTLVSSIVSVFVISVLAAIASSYYAIEANERGIVLKRRLAAADMRQAFAAYDQGVISHVRQFLNTLPREGKTWEQERLESLIADRSFRTIIDKRLRIPDKIDSWRSDNLAVSPDGAQLISAGDDGQLRLWNLNTGTLDRELRIQPSPVLSTDWSPDGAEVIATSKSGQVRICNLKSGECVLTLQLDADEKLGKTPWAVDAFFGPAENQVTVVQGHPIFAVRIYDRSKAAWISQSPLHSTLEGLAVKGNAGADAILIGETLYRGLAAGTPKPEKSLAVGERAICAAFCDNNCKVALGFRSKQFEVWDLLSAERLWTQDIHEGAITAIAVSADNQLIATGGTDTAIRIWDTASRELVQTLYGHRGTIQTLHFVAPRKLASSATDKTIKLWEIDSNPSDQSFTFPVHGMSSVEFSEDGQTLLFAALASGHLLFDHLSQASTIRTLDDSWVRDAEFRPRTSPLNREWALATDDHLLEVWGTGDSPRLSLKTQKYAAGVCYSPSGRQLAAVDFSGHARVFDADSGTELWCQSLGTAVVESVQYSPDGRWIACGDLTGGITLLHARDGQRQWQRSHSRRIHDLAFRPDGKRLAAACHDGKVVELDLDGNVLRHFESFAGSATALRYSLDGSRLFVGYSTGYVTLWSKEGFVLLTTPALDGPIRSIATSRNGSSVAIVGDSNLVKIWSTGR